MDSLTALSPLDGRYANTVAPLRNYFSEFALLRYRILVEVEYFIALSREKKIRELPKLSLSVEKKLRSLYENFNEKDARQIKKIEKITNHDVKAVEYFLKEKLERLGLKKYTEFIHFALTSEDCNNLSYSLEWQEGLHKIYQPKLLQLIQKLKALAKRYQGISLLSLTHGQSATPTTVGKELAVFAARLSRQYKTLAKEVFLGKLSGATGTWSAQSLAYPDVEWVSFTKKFIHSLGLEPNLLTTQIENHDSLAESYHILERINSILLDFTRDVWLYIMRGVFAQKKKAGEIGSSTMPHKINPIQFENAEGNLGIANAYFSHLASKLPISRLQRDLSDSTVLRNQGVPLGHSFLSVENILTGLERLVINEQRINEELGNHYEILAEAIQVVLRKVGYPKPYEKLKEFTRGQMITKETLRSFIQSLSIPEKEKNKLLKLTPRTYIGLASKLINFIPKI